MTFVAPFAISFGSPVALLGLALIPMAMLLQRMFRRRAQKYAVRYTGVATLAAVLGTTPAWRRHLPAALALLAMATLVFALAKPSRTVAVPAEQASVVLVTDHSRSMMATDVSPTRLEAARNAALRFLSKVPKGRFEAANGPATLCGVGVEISDRTGLAEKIAPFRRGPRLEETAPSFWS